MTTAREGASEARLRGRVALVTGSSRGIGAAIARAFAREGAVVALHGRDRDALASVQRDIEARGGRAGTFVADVTRLDELQTMCGRIEAELGPVDVLVCCAGGNFTPPHLPLEEITPEGWRASLEPNLTGTFLTLKCVLPAMKARGRGSIVTISSAAARRPTALTPVAYAAAKAGIQTLTQLVASQAGPAGVRANCIAPETILTEENDRRIPDDVKRRMVGEHPVRRLGTPEDVAEAALFLASDASAWISGVVLDIAGGGVMR